MHRMSMEAENRNSIKYVMVIHNKMTYKIQNIVVIAIFTSNKIHCQRNHRY